MDVETLRNLSEDGLTSYLWHRLRHEEPMDPPVSNRFRIEPPEEFVLDIALRTEDIGFRSKLIAAIRRNLERLLPLATVSGFDPVSGEQLGSLAYMCTVLRDDRLSDVLYAHSLAWFSHRDRRTDDDEVSVFHVLRALADIQNDAKLVPFWASIWMSAANPALRSVAYYGHVKADSLAGLTHLGTIAIDDGIDLPPLIWKFATDYPGAILLGAAASKLPIQSRAIIRKALAEAGADSDLLRDFDLNAVTELPQRGFRFDVPPPRDEASARFRPVLLAA